MVIRNLLRVLAATTVLAAAPQVHAQLFRAYLASDGLDSNPCTLASPCRLLPAAITAVADGGEIWMLDSANFNASPVNVTKSVTILAIPGAVGSVVATSGPALSVNTAGVKLTLRNLVMGPFASGATAGVLMQAANAELTIDRCMISNMPVAGIVLSSGVKARVVNSLFRGNAWGMYVTGDSRLVVAGTQVLGSGSHAVYANGNGAGQTQTVDISDSILSGNGGSGAFAEITAANATVNLVVSRSTISQNGSHGVVSSSTIGLTNVVVGSSTIVSNTGYAMMQAGGGSLLTSFGNNIVRLNTSGNSSGTITAASTL